MISLVSVYQSIGPGWLSRSELGNQEEVCDYFKLLIDYFTPSKEIYKEEIVESIQREQCNRQNSPVKRIQLQSRLLGEVARYFTIT